MTAGTAMVGEIQERVRGVNPGTRLLPVAGASKPGLSRSQREDVELLDLSELSGIVEYDPAELTITALAGTPVLDVQAALAEHGQWLPFDPPLAAAGATLGGVVAAGASGSAALRHGRVRDFIIGVRFVDGTGRLINGGGKVVKNAAGFDLPKLMVGAAGRLGVMVQLSFKVFPRPVCTATLQFELDDPGNPIADIRALADSPVELEALDLTADGLLLARVGGRPETLDSRIKRLTAALSSDPKRHDGHEERQLWQDASEFAWVPQGSTLVRVPITIRQLTPLSKALDQRGEARYVLGGTVAWISWPAQRPLAELEAILSAQGLAGMVLIGPPDQTLLGPTPGASFRQRIIQAIDPHSRFLEL